MRCSLKQKPLLTSFINENLVVVTELYKAHIRKKDQKHLSFLTWLKTADCSTHVIKKYTNFLRCHELKEPGYFSILPDGRVLYAKDEGAQIWNVETNQCELILKENDIFHIGKVTILSDNRIAVYYRELNVYRGGFYSITMHHNVVKIWNISSEECTVNLEDSSWLITEKMNSIVELPDQRIACGLFNGLIQIWDIHSKNARLLFTLKAHREAITALEVTPTGDLISADNSGIIKIWDLRSRKCKHTLRCPEEGLRSLILYDDYLIANNNKDVFIWTIPTLRNNANATISFHEKLKNYTEENIKSPKDNTLLFRTYFLLNRNIHFLEKALIHGNSEVLRSLKIIKYLFQEEASCCRYGETSPYELFNKNITPRIEKALQERDILKDFKMRYFDDYNGTLFRRSHIDTNQITLQKVVEHALNDKAFFGGRNRTFRILVKMGLINQKGEMTSLGENTGSFKNLFNQLPLRP